MDLEIDGKVAFVTGSSRGIGKAIAIALKSEGCRVIVNGRDEANVRETAQEIGAPFVIADVSTEVAAREAVGAAFGVYKQLDILVCNVGSGASLAPGKEDEAEWLRMININLLAAVNTVSAARSMFGPTGGAIVCISSICGSAALGAPIAYSGAKAALDSYVRGAARYLAKENIRINAVVPGNILFPGGAWEQKLADSPESINAFLRAEVPLGRFGLPEEIGSMCAFLASPRSAFTTGALFVVDGGQLRS